MTAENIIILVTVFICLSPVMLFILIGAILSGKRGGESLNIWTEESDDSTLGN